MVKHLRTVQETQVQSWNQEDPLDLAWKIPWTEEPGRLQSMGSQRVEHDFSFLFVLRQLMEDPSSSKHTLSRTLSF